VQEIQRYFQKGGYEHLFLDTAGRMHVDNQMLQELSAINSTLNPKYKLMVLDSMTGQESLRVAQAFEQAVGFNGAILTKMDSETLGGAALAFRYVLQKPIYFIGSGEKVADLEQFHADRLATRLLGLGDLQTLMERAQDKIKLVDQERSMKALQSGQMTLEDFAQQMEMVSKLGSLNKVIQYLPGLSGVNITPEMAEKGDQELRRFRVIISSMTRKERLEPKIIDPSRRQRIAKGAGVKLEDVNYLLQRFEQSAQFVKLLKKQGRFQNMFKF
jgi:signal recognition particle subunit SRP54